MLIDSIQAELVRLQLHPVNLSASGGDDPLVALQGSLLRYWSLPPCLDGPWLLAQLQRLPDAAGPEVVMRALAAASETMNTKAGESRTQLRLFDAPSRTPASKPVALNEDS
jgi:hypothetical protein